MIEISDFKSTSDDWVNNYEDKHSFFRTVQGIGDNKQIDARVEYISKIETSGSNYKITAYCYVWMKSQKKSWGVWKAQNCDYQINLFTASVWYPNLDYPWSPVRHNIGSNTEFESDSPDRYYQFVYDSFFLEFTSVPQGDIIKPTEITIQANITSTLNEDRYLNMNFNETFNSGFGFASGYPEWHHNN